MELVIESTDQIVSIDGVECRVWKGVTKWNPLNPTAPVVECELYVHRIRVATRDDNSEFERSLSEQPIPAEIVSRSVERFPDACIDPETQSIREVPDSTVNGAS